jgi:branched-chain amino acid transport system substrate-binding protein
MAAFTNRLRRAAVAGVAVGALALAGCAGGLGGGGGEETSGSGGEGAPIKIGYVSPQTGALAEFGAADDYVIGVMEDYYAANPIVTSDGVSHPVEIIVKDAQSDPNTAAGVASELILQDDVDLVLSQGTPDMTNPVADTCEANQVLCISSNAPWQSYYFGRGATPDTPFKYTYHFFWGLEDLEVNYNAIWEAVAPEAASVGLLLPNDPDGNAWASPETGFPPFIEGLGKTVTNPGMYENVNPDFSSQIAAFKAAGDQIIAGVPIPPDFTTFWTQSAQQGFHPAVATIAKAILFPASVEALGPDLGNNLSTEVWWHPTYPFTNSLTGQSAQEVADGFEEATGQQWTQPIGFVEALFEVATHVLETSPSLSADDLAATTSKLNIDTVVGKVDWTSGPVPNVAKTVLTAGQWRSNGDGTYDLVIVANPQAPELPLSGKPEPINW